MINTFFKVRNVVRKWDKDGNKLAVLSKQWLPSLS